MDDSINALVTKFAEYTRTRDEAKDVNEANRYTKSRPPMILSIALATKAETRLPFSWKIRTRA